MNLAWLKDHVRTMAELAKYTEPDEEVKSSSVWELVEKEQNRRCEGFAWIRFWNILYFYHYLAYSLHFNIFELMWIFPNWQREVLGLLKKQQKQIDEQEKQIADMSKKIEYIAMRVAWGLNAWYAWKGQGTTKIQEPYVLTSDCKL